MKIEKVIFDLGKVLVKFNPKNPFKNIFESEDEMNFFFKNICTWEWHINQDIVYDTRPVCGWETMDMSYMLKCIKS